MTYALHLAILVGIYGLLALSLHLTVGLLGLVSICQAAFFGIGAYVAAQAGAAGLDGGLVIAAAAVGGLLPGMATSLLLTRLGGDYFAIASFTVQAIVLAAFVNLRPITGGPSGLDSIPRLSFAGMSLTGWGAYLALVWGFVVVVVLASRAMRHSPAGRVCAMLRQDEVAVVALGFNPVRFRVALFATGSAIAAVAGALYATYMSFINPTPFAIGPAIMVLSCVILGGVGSELGAVLGASVFVLLPEVLRFVGLPAAAAANIRQILFGIALIVVMAGRGRFRSFRWRFSRRSGQADASR